MLRSLTPLIKLFDTVIPQSRIAYIYYSVDKLKSSRRASPVGFLAPLPQPRAIPQGSCGK